MAVKSVNDTAGPDGLISTLLVSGTYPRLSETSPPSTLITARAEAIRKAMTLNSPCNACIDVPADTLAVSTLKIFTGPEN